MRIIEHRFVVKRVDGLFRVYDQSRGSFPYITRELGPVLQDVPEHAASVEANRLNTGVASHRETGRHQQILTPSPSGDEDPLDEEITSDRLSDDSNFVPARDKLEAVTRISTWTGATAATLGPGSTEHKAVLIGAASFLGLRDALWTLSKPVLARALVENLGGVWDETCSSTGSTVTLAGLNRLLKALESRTHSRRVVTGRQHPADEARVLLKQVIGCTPQFFDGRNAVTIMREAESTDWAKSEWSGFYFEFVALGPCMAAINGAPVPTSTRTVFDIGGAFVWDFKVHSEGKPWAILNDRIATDFIVAERGGIGFVVLSGRPYFDPDFKQWHDTEKVRYGKVRRPRAQSPSYRRRLKSSFTPQRVDIIYLTADDWALAVDDGIIRPWNQPRQPGGQPRNSKYQMNVALAAARWGVADSSV